MIELLMLLVMPSEINPTELGLKFVLKDKFVDYQSCKEYVKKNTYYKEGDAEMDGLFYKIDDKEYKVFLTYCKPVEEKNGD
jgi:hypothetical protein